MHRIHRYILLLVCLLLARFLGAQSGQIAVPRVDLMPDQPSPFSMRDWKNVAIQYDSFIYDKNKTGQYLPLVNYNNNGINYPTQKQIRLHTYVGTNSPNNSEGINVLQSLVGAALVGQDIRTVYGQDRLVMAQDFFNKKNGENIYLNNASAGSGGDWWYDVMPNVYFYQLYDLYPEFNAEADFQFNTIAEKFLTATQKMGGNATPWTSASMNYRAWNFKTMEGNASGVKEPETAGTFGWLLYHAYKKTGDKSYLQSAEWSMEYLNSLTSNPSYELQLPYGTYIAAKMNAEVGTDYDINKMVNWCFDRGPLRGWGTIVGKWGSFDVSGLVGEANDGGNDYAFLMNGMQQAAALVPMVRYDKRFAKAIGKWMLNLSNASRLLYPGYLPATLQDGAAWSQTNDSKALISHEAMKQKVGNLSPFATGDAVGGGWAATNLAIYGSSAVGFLGALIEKTSDPKILQLDLNATDFYSDTAYPSYLYYNPYDIPKTITLNSGEGVHDIYESITESFIHQDVSGNVTISIPAKQAILVVVTPANGIVTYDKNKMLVNNVIIDYNQSKNSFTYGPRIKALEPITYIIEKGTKTTVFCTAEDKDSDVLRYTWYSDNGIITGNNNEVELTAPQNIGQTKVKVIVSDPEGNSDSLSIMLDIVNVINRAPIIHSLSASTNVVSSNASLQLVCEASDPNGDAITYTWTAAQGLISGQGAQVQWTAPQSEGVYEIKVRVADNQGLSVEKTISILVKNFDGNGDLIAWYPFSGNTQDLSGNNHHGTNKGGLLTTDFNGNANNAYYFNDGSQHIEVTSTTKLNTTEAISVSLWCKPAFGEEKEIFLLSHGSWQNRWKLSITPTRNVRWTVNTSTRIVDLDVTRPLISDSVYHIVASYDGKNMLIYVNGKLESFTNQTGAIKTTSLPMLIGQMLPTDAQYNFKGVIDDVRIYNFALSPNVVATLYNQGVSDLADTQQLDDIQILPNPANQFLTIKSTEFDQFSEIVIADLSGKNIQSLYNWNIENPLDVSQLKSGIYFLTIRQGSYSKSIQFLKI